MRKKRSNVALEVKTFDGKSGTRYLVFKTAEGSYHVFAETEAKQAAKDCGAEGNHTRDYWRSLWNAGSSSPED
jgi:hypothetical protein